MSIARSETVGVYQSPLAPMLAGVAFLAFYLLLTLNNHDLAAATLMAATTILILWAAWRVQSSGAFLLCALLLVQVFSSVNFIPISVEQRFFLRYPLLIVFCLPAVVVGLGKRELFQGGFLNYLIYFGWAAVSVSYSLLPGYSAGRLLGSIMIFIALVRIAQEVTGPCDITRLLQWWLIGAAAVWIALLLSFVVLPNDMIWSQDYASTLLRFNGMFGSPNQVGEITLVTVGVGLLAWPSTSGWKKAMLATLMAVAIALGALADSRTPFVVFAIGGMAYLLWKYRLRAVPICLALGVLGIVLAGEVKSEYFTRGEVMTFTGRAEVWKFEIAKILERPLIGWGFEVEGQIMQAKDFPIWWGPWEDGPHSSLHNAYLSKAVGLGIPALLFWVFFFMRPWVSLFQRKEDPWRLKPLFFLVVLPMLGLAFMESTSGESRSSVGLLFTLSWALAERQRLWAASCARVPDWKNTQAMPTRMRQKWGLER